MKLPYDMTWIEAGMYGLVLSLLLVLGWIGLRRVNAVTACLAAGYPQYQLTLKEVYCVRRVNQTDEVVLLDKTGGVAWSK
jgi:hypothetical protein